MLTKHISLLSAPLAIHADSQDQLLPIVAKLVKGEDPFDFDNDKLKAEYYITDQNRTIEYYLNDQAGEDVLASYDINGIIRSFGYFDEAATNVLMRRMAQNEANPRVVAHFLNINSPGGDATTMLSAAEYIRTKISKPVVAFVNGSCMSAAYCLAAAANRVFASSKLDRVGSIGIVTTVRNMTKAYEQMGIQVTEVYADPSKDKNMENRAAMAGDFTPLKENYLNPLAEAFIALMKAYRPKSADKPVFTGKAYLAQDGLDNGLIDGIKNYEEAVSAAFAMAKKGNKPSNYNSSPQKVNPMKILGIEVFGKPQADGTVVLTAEAYAALEAKAREQEKTQFDAQVAASVNAATADLQAKVNSLTDRLEKALAFIENTPAGEAAKPQNPQAETKELTKWEAYNQRVAAAMATGTTLPTE